MSNHEYNICLFFENKIPPMGYPVLTWFPLTSPKNHVTQELTKICWSLRNFLALHFNFRQCQASQTFHRHFLPCGARGGVELNLVCTLRSWESQQQQQQQQRHLPISQKFVDRMFSTLAYSTMIYISYSVKNFLPVQMEFAY